MIHSAHAPSADKEGGSGVSGRLRGVALSATVCLFIVIGDTRTASAVDVNWTCASQFFDISACWSPAVPPGEADTAVFNGAGVQTVRWDVAVLGNWQAATGSVTPVVTNQGLRVENGDVTIRSDTATVFSYNVIGNADIINGGRLRIGLAGQPMVVDVGADTIINSGGILDVTGTGSAWNATSNFDVGNSSTGELNVEAGGLVSNTDGFIGTQNGATGIATVSGAGSVWDNSAILYVGYAGSGTLVVADGGVVSNFAGRVGDLSTASGTVTVTGANSHWNSVDYLSVGDASVGELNVEAGGLVTDVFGTVGSLVGSTGTVTVSGLNSQWTNSNHLFVADSGTGTLNINAGGSVSNTLGILGNFANSTGMATVSGAGSLWVNSNHLFVANFGTGTLNIEAGGVVSNIIGSIGLRLGSTGMATVTGPGAQWNNSEWLDVGASGTGTLNVEAGGAVSNTHSTIGRNAGSTGTAIVTGPGSTWTNNGTLFVGGNEFAAGGAGTLTINDSGTVNVAGTLTVWDAGTIVVNSGTLTIDSTGGTGINLGGGQVNVGLDEIGTLSIVGGGVVSNSGSFIGRNAGSDGVATVSGPGSLWNSANRLEVGSSGEGMLTVADGGVVSDPFGFIGRYIDSQGTATVTGAGSEWNNSIELQIGPAGVGELNTSFGGNVNAGNSLTVGANGTLNMLEGTGVVTSVNFDASLGTFNHEDGELVVNGGTHVPAFGIRVSGEFNPIVSLESGASSVSAELARIGSFEGGTGTLNIRGGSTVDSAGGVVGVLGGNGTVNVEGLGSIWLAADGLIIGDEPNLTLQLLGISDQGIGMVRVADGAVLNTFGNDAQINRQGTLELAGGDVFGTVVDVNGTLSGYGNVNTRVNGGFSSVINAIGGTLSIGNANLATSFQSNGTLYVNPGATLHFETAGTYAALATDNYVFGGNITSTYGVALDTGSNLVAYDASSVDTRVAAARGSVISAFLGDLTLGDASAFDGFHTDGGLAIYGNRTVTLNDADEAVLGSITLLGYDEAGPGTLIAANGLLVNFGNTISGYGVVVGDILNNGLINGQGPGFFDLIDLQGLVNGVGDFGGTVQFSGGFSPGLSPTITNGANFIFNSVLELELGGLTPGAEHDQILASGFVALGGVLDVLLIDAWVPSLDDAYVLILADQIVSLDAQNQPVFPAFAQVNFPDLAAGLQFLLEFNLNPTGQDSLVLRVAAVPLPAAVWMFGAALVSLLAGRRTLSA